jgi:hypothetical protein
MFEIIKKHRKYRHTRKDYYIKWDINFMIDRGSAQIWSFLPTIIWCPWYCRYPGQSIFNIMWFNWDLAIGKWCRKEDDE